MKNSKSSFFERLTGSTDARNKIEIDDSLDLQEEVSAITKQEDDAELAIDMYQTPTEIIVRTMVAGVKPEDLQVSIGRDIITIKGARSSHHEVSEKDFFAKELYWGSFTRTIMLPSEVDADNAEAVEKHGLLTIKLPKIEKDKTKSLKIKSM
ncbi:MAG TPA: Hsp20/alpha crystallin family protein [Candidatus Paceibacterota bacterium]|nr:Hsp20/alpha crystallin family protein [Candidatus Paceibacterota bacterium]